MNSADLLVSGGTFVTMDAKSRVIENGAAAIRRRVYCSNRRASRNRIAASGPENDRRQRRSGSARADQWTCARRHEPVSRIRRRPFPERLAAEVYLPRRSTERYGRLRRMGNPAKHGRDDPWRNHDLRGHVLLRRCGRARHQGGRDARNSRRDDRRFSRPRSSDASRRRSSTRRSSSINGKMIR